MTSCTHSKLALLPGEKAKLRCQHCHLTITPEELGRNPCPECLERDGKRRYDFEEVAGEPSGKTRYRCEECSIVIEID